MWLDQGEFVASRFGFGEAHLLQVANVVLGPSRRRDRGDVLVNEELRFGAVEETGLPDSPGIEGSRSPA